MQALDSSDTNTSDPTGAPLALRFNQGCVLNSLSASQQEQLYDWLELLPAKAVLEMVAMPAPDGFGIKMHLTTLRRFHLRARARFQKQLVDSTAETNGDFAVPPGALEELTNASMRQFAAELATVQGRDPAHFATVARWVLRLQQNARRERELQIAENRLELEKSKAEPKKPNSNSMLREQP